MLRLECNVLQGGVGQGRIFFSYWKFSCKVASFPAEAVSGPKEERNWTSGEAVLAVVTVSPARRTRRELPQGREMGSWSCGLERGTAVVAQDCPAS